VQPYRSERAGFDAGAASYALRLVEYDDIHLIVSREGFGRADLRARRVSALAAGDGLVYRRLHPDDAEARFFWVQNFFMAKSAIQFTDSAARAFDRISIEIGHVSTPKCLCALPIYFCAFCYAYKKCLTLNFFD
jgi:hypothetical protein